MKTFLLLAGMQAVIYALFAIDYRAITAMNYPVAFSVNMLITALQFSVIQRIIKDPKGMSARLGFMIGSSVGVILGMLISTRLL